MPQDATNTIDNGWENGELGREEKHVRRSTESREQSLDGALELQLISIRLQKELIEQLKFIGEYRGVGYQPLIRDILCRWTRTEMFVIAEEMKKELQAKEATAAARKRA
ncbi:MAG TPA: hypothetical protein VGG49_06160 [Steroidobacteraceae bacterium]